MFRRFISPVLYYLARLLLYRGKLDDVWSGIIELPEDEFFDVIYDYDWLSDPLWGVWDFTNINPNLFFSEKPEFSWMSKRRWSRDCDDWCDLIFRWAKHKGYPVWMIYLCDSFGKGAHCTCVYKKDGKYVLADYKVRDRVDSLEEAMDLYKKDNWLAHGKYKKLRWYVYKRSS
jgi:hypothetical protein